MTLVTLGSAVLERGGPPGRVLLERGKPLACLIYLALAPRRSASRDELIDLLWGNVVPERGRASVRQALFTLRSVVGEGIISADGPSIRLEGTVDVDRDRFLSLVEQNLSGDAVRAYRGPFLADLTFPGGAAFDEWVATERRRLEVAFRRSAEAHVTRLLDSGQFREAIADARTARRLAPDWPGGWRMLIEALEANGDRLAARAECDSLVDYLDEHACTIDPRTQATIRSLKESDGRQEAADTPFIPELIGREAEFASLMHRWERARLGGRSVVIVAGASGLGKSRLLHEFESRLRAVRTQVVSVRALAGDADIPYALAADLSAVLARLPGSAGVSPSTARAIVDLAPSLEGQFAAPSSVVRSGDDLLRHRASALAELLTCVSEERPVAVLLDDWHWADADSRRIIASLAGRLPPRVLLVVAVRTTDDIPFEMSELVKLSALSLASVHEILLSLGASATDAAMSALASELYRACGGSPQLVEDFVLHGIETRVLTREGDTLSCVDAVAAQSCVARGDALSSRIADAPPDGRALLQVLAVSGQRATVEELAALVDGRDADVRAALVELSARRLVAVSNGTWGIAHDSIAAMIGSSISEVDERRIRGAIGRRSAQHATDERMAGLAMRQLLRAGAYGDAERFARAWVRTRRSSGDRRASAELLSRVLPVDCSAADVRRIRRSLPLHERLGRVRLAFAAASVGVVVTASAFYAAQSLTRLTLHTIVTPIALSQDPATRAFTLAPTPVFEVHDRRGRLMPIADTIDASVVSGPAQLAGRTSESVVAGRSRFSSLELAAGDSAVIEFRLRSARAAVRLPFRNLRAIAVDSLHLESGRLAGQEVSWSHPEITVSPGSRIDGRLTFRYTATSADATYWLAGTPTWGDAASGAISFGALSAPATSGQRTELLDLVAPVSEGLYYLLFTFRAEPSAPYVLSMTNWNVGRPRWGDGNDLATLSGDNIERAHRGGRTTLLLYRVYEGHLSYLSDEIPIAFIRVRVRRTSTELD